MLEVVNCEILDKYAQDHGKVVCVDHNCPECELAHTLEHVPTFAQDLEEISSFSMTEEKKIEMAYITGFWLAWDYLTTYEFAGMKSFSERQIGRKDD